MVVHVPAGGRSQAGVPDGGPGAGRAWREEAQPAHRRLGVRDTKERVHLIKSKDLFTAGCYFMSKKS